MNNKYKKLNITSSSKKISNNDDDIKKLEKYAGLNLPEDFKQFFKLFPDATLSYPNDKYLYIGGSSSENIIETYNVLTHQFLTIPHLAIGSNGMSQTILYAINYNKTGIYKIDDDEIDDDELTFLAETFDDLILRKKGFELLD